MKKYKILKNNQKEYRGYDLYQIEALRDITLINGKFVKKGDKGGWIEKENNLSHNGNCWVETNSMVFAHSVVMDNALVRDADDKEIKDIGESDSCSIIQDSVISDNAIISHSEIHNATIKGNAKIIEAGVLMICQ